MKLGNPAAIGSIAALAVAQAPAVQELDARGNAHQETAHQQLTGEAPITNILEALAPGFPEIAKKARVAMIVADLPYADSSVEKVDVTEMLLDWLKADERTRTIVQGLK